MNEALAGVVRELAGPGAIPDKSRAMRRLRDIPNPCSLPPVAVHWLVDGMIPAGAISLLTGSGGVGKSFLLADLVRAALAGGNWLGRTVSAVPEVLVLDRENPLGVIQQRLERLGLDRVEGLRWWGGWLDYPFGSFTDLDMLDLARRQCLIIVDSLAAYFDGDSENDSAQIRQWFNALRRLADLGATVMVVHHSGKSESGKNFRGSSAIRDAVDAGFLLERDGVEGSSPMTALRLTCFKLRAAGDLRPIHLRLGESCFEVTADPSADSERDRLDRLADAIGRHSSGMTAREIDGLAGELKVSRGDVREGLKRLEIDGRVVKRDGRYVAAGPVVVEV